MERIRPASATPSSAGPAKQRELGGELVEPGLDRRAGPVGDGEQSLDLLERRAEIRVMLSMIRASHNRDNGEIRGAGLSLRDGPRRRTARPAGTSTSGGRPDAATGSRLKTKASNGRHRHIEILADDLAGREV